MKQLNVIKPDHRARKSGSREYQKTFIFNVIEPSADRFHGRTLDLPDFDGSPRLLPADMIKVDGQVA